MKIKEIVLEALEKVTEDLSGESKEIYEGMAKYIYLYAKCNALDRNANNFIIARVANYLFESRGLNMAIILEDKEVRILDESPAKLINFLGARLYNIIDCPLDECTDLFEEFINSVETLLEKGTSNIDWNAIDKLDEDRFSDNYSECEVENVVEPKGYICVNIKKVCEEITSISEKGEGFNKCFEDVIDSLETNSADYASSKDKLIYTLLDYGYSIGIDYCDIAPECAEVNISNYSDADAIKRLIEFKEEFNNNLVDQDFIDCMTELIKELIRNQEAE